MDSFPLALSKLQYTRNKNFLKATRDRSSWKEKTKDQAHSDNNNGKCRGRITFRGPGKAAAA